MIKNFEQLIEMLRSQTTKRRIAVVAAQNEHTLEAVVRAAKDGLVTPVLLGDEAQICELLLRFDLDPKQTKIVNEPDPTVCAQLAADMARSGQIDCIMKGRLETGALMKVLVNKDTGIRKNDTMSLLAFFESPYYHKIFAITDPGLLTYPTQEQKVAAICNAVDALHAIGIQQPKVAVLAAVEKVNPKMRETVEAAAIKEMQLGGCVVEGPISYDLAMDPQSAVIKGYQSPVAGDADLLVAPDITSANLAAKSITVLGGGRTGGMVLGAQVPVLIVSRAATADDKYMSIVIAALIGGTD